MLIFGFCMAFSLGLITLALGVAGVVWSNLYKNACSSLVRVMGYTFMIVALLNMLGLGYYVAKYWHEDSFDRPYPAMMMEV